MYMVVFRNERGEKVEKVFDSYYLCRKFINKLRHSKKCRLIFTPPMDE